MEEPLWTTKYAPDLSDLRQASARDQFEGALERPTDLLVHGPPGVGKTAAVRALAAELHERPDSDLIEINVADFFDRKKSEITNDPRFESFLTGKSDLSKRDMINHVLQESAGYKPVTGEFKTLLLDNAEAAREDFQQALRRVMERHHRTTQFVLATRQPTNLIPPLRSRCVAVPMPAPSTPAIAAIIEEIVEAEDVTYDQEGIEFIAGHANGDIREAILAAQTTAAATDEITMETAYETLDSIGLDETVSEMLAAATSGQFEDARSTLDDLLVDEGLSGNEVLHAILETARSQYDGRRLARLYTLAGDVDFDQTDGSNDRVQIGRLLAELGGEE